MMRYVSILLLWLMATGQTLAQSGTGKITGTIQSAQGDPLPGISVGLEGTLFGAPTNGSGEFSLSNIPAGTYTLTTSGLGYAANKQNITVSEGKTTRLNLQLDESTQQLSEVVIAGWNKPLTRKESDYVARMPLKNLENPQVYTVVPKALLEQQVAVSINQALTNATGAAPMTYPAGGFGITSRGFQTGINARNGMETVASRSSIDIGNVERIEVIKGPSGTLFGATVSSFGGVVNLVTKKPFDTFGGEASYTLGSFGLNRLTVDVNTPLDEEKRGLFRINAAVNRQKSFLNNGYNNTVLIAPSLSYRLSDRFTVLVDAEYLNVDQTRSTYSRVAANSGITNPADIQLDYHKALYLEDANALTHSSKFFVEGNYRISGRWTSSTLFSFVSEQAKQSYQYYPTWISPTQAARNVLIYGPIHNNYTNLQQNFTGRVNTGSVAHKILAGVNYRYYNGAFNYTSSGNRFVDTVDVSKSFTALNKARIDQFMLSYGSMIPFSTSDQHTYSAYATDVVTLFDRLSAMLSLRVDRFDYRGVSGTDAYQQTSLAPKLGLVYQLVKDRVSVFGSYMSGFQNTAPINQPDGNLLVLKPIYANQSEGGIKAELLNHQLNLNLSYYYIAIDNATRTDENRFTIQDAKQVSKGIELEVTAHPTSGLSIVAGYAYNDNRIIRTTDRTVEGNKAAGAPENVANFWLSYSLQQSALKGLGLGFGGNFVDKAYFATTNTYYLPAYSTLNGTLFYGRSNWRMALKVNNLGNRKYWDLWGAPQATRNVAANLTFRF